MKILYVGTLNPGGTCFSRLQALRDMESDVATFDVDQHLGLHELPWWHQHLEAFTLCGPRTMKANAALRRSFARVRPDLVWIDKGDWIAPSTVKSIRTAGAFLVHHNTDALYPTNALLRFDRRRLRSTASNFDVFFTTNIDDYRLLKKNGEIRAELTHLGYAHQRFEPSPLSDELGEIWNHPMSFAGHYEPRTAAGMEALVDAGLPLSIFGYHWDRSDGQGKLAPHIRGPLADEDYVRALKGAQIGLCFVSELNYNQTASRSFEIPACGTFLLAMRTPQHLEAYEEGQEAEFFGDNEELVQKVRYYLEHDEERRAIARRGHERCVGSCSSWHKLMRRDWSRTLEIYHASRPSKLHHRDDR